MGFSKDNLSEIIAALEKKAPQGARCSVCGKRDWGVQDDLIALVLQQNFPHLSLSGETLPCIALTCGNCGNTQLINLIVLGLRHLIEEKKEPKVEKKKKVE